MTHVSASLELPLFQCSGVHHKQVSVLRHCLSMLKSSNFFFFHLQKGKFFQYVRYGGNVTQYSAVQDNQVLSQ